MPIHLTPTPDVSEGMRAEPAELPAVLVRSTGMGWEVLGCFITADGEKVRRSLDLFTTEALAQRAAATFLKRLRRFRTTAGGQSM